MDSTNAWTKMFFIHATATKFIFTERVEKETDNREAITQFDITFTHHLRCTTAIGLQLPLKAYVLVGNKLLFFFLLYIICLKGA